MTRIEPSNEEVMCQGIRNNPCVLKQKAAHTFVEVKDYDVVIIDLCSECYESLHSGEE